MLKLKHSTDIPQGDRVQQELDNKVGMRVYFPSLLIASVSHHWQTHEC